MNSYSFKKDNWGDLEEFQGDFINFGYWKNTDCNSFISYENRIKSSENLYLYILNKLDLHPQDQVLEVGCGRGMGILTLLNHFSVKSITGIDSSLDQITRTKRNINDIKNIVPGQIAPQLNLCEASAENTLLDDHSIDKIYSVEVIQHLKNFTVFGNELKRILKSKGRIVLTAHLSTSDVSYQKIRKENLVIENDELLPVNNLVDVLKQLNFNVKYYSIGKEVFPGFNKWLSQINATKVSSYIYEAYLRKYIDYYVIIADNA